ncbi:lipoprotein [Edaphobacter acidisoli]|uniref:Lipoprotein n=2 Tax=Edaphobacter acidisoli TaxID=2040573 RepID=A0A916RUS3_9BACT|nr:lipoprotein [Edaphobacter acidisoli]
MAHVQLQVSDPSTCQAPNGPFEHVYVTIADVQANVSSSAGSSDSGWVDLTPGLSGHPVQIDLLGQASNQCFLASLGDPQELQPGKYQQIRVILTDNTSATDSKELPNNLCTNGVANCVVLNDNTVHTLQLSSEANTGIKIPPGQIANGGLTVAAGDTKELDIDFNTCVSIVEQGNGVFRLKPVLHAGEVTTSATSINGTVIDSVTGNPTTGPVLVALEQKDANGVDRVFMNTLTNTSGQFVFCPLPSGTYDVVIVGETSASAVYAPTVITGVSTGSALGTVQLHPSTVASAAASLQGMVTSQNGATPAAATSIDVQVSALEQVATGLTVTMPQVPSTANAVLALTTGSSTTCPAAKDCVSYTLLLPAAVPYVGAFAAGGTTLAQSVLPASYTVDGIALVPSSGGTLDCSPSEQQATPITPVAGTTLPVTALAFAGCQ